MTPEVSKQIANLLGQVTVSELPQDTGSLFTGEYWLYKYKETPASNVDTTAYVIQAGDFYNYLCKNVFAFLVEQKQNDIELHPGDFLDKNDTPVIMARKLLDRVPNWIGEVKPANGGKNLSELWFKHFQYYYFDNLNNRLPTMLLKYGPAAIREKTFDILIWLDASGSMWDEIHDLADSIYDLGRIVFAQNPNNRISIVMFRRGGYWETSEFERRIGDNTYSSWTKQNAIHLPFTSYDNGLGMERIGTYMHSLADWFENNDGLFDENVWFLNNLAYDSYHFKPTDTEKLADFDTTWSANGWDVGWRKQEDCTCPLTKMIVAISDEIADPYISITGNVMAAYKSDTVFPSQLSVNVQGENWTWNGPSPDKKVQNINDVLSGNCKWLTIPRSMFYVIQNGQHMERDPYCGKEKEEDKVDGKWVHQYYPGFCNYASRWPDRCPNNGYANSGALGQYPNHYGYDPTVHTLEKFFKGFKDNDVQFRFLYTGGEAVMKITEFDRREFETCRLYVHRWQEDIISKMYDATKNKQYGFLHLITQTTVGESLMDIFTNEAILGDDSLWSNSMWESHLDEKTVQTLPFVITKESQIKKIYVPDTAVISNENGGSTEDSDDFIWKRYDRRNYIRIVTGGWDKTNDRDWTWTDEKAGMGTTIQPNEPSREGTDDDPTPPAIPKIDQDMGDIDQTLMVMEEFLDDASESIEPMNHKGKVIFTASKERRPVNGAWSNVLGNDNECFVWSGGSSLTGENTTKMSNLPKHHHNTVLNEDTPLSIQNVSIVGRPEGETVGGIVKVPTAERMPETDNGKAEDTAQDMISTGAVLNESPGGAYCGTVVYSPYEVHAEQQGHNNMPLYYKMRAFVHG